MNNNNNPGCTCYPGSIIADFLNDRKNPNYPRYVAGATGPTGPTGPTHPIKSEK